MRLKPFSQNHICADCGRQFIENPQTNREYSDDVRKVCLKMSLNGMGFRGMERVTDLHHTTVINWVKQTGENLPNIYNPEEIAEVGELDELQTFVGSKKTKSPKEYRSAYGFGQPSITSSQVF